jgi:hypothetical protein
MSEEEVKEETQEEPSKGLMAESKVAKEEAETEDIAHDVQEAELKKPDFLPDEYWDAEKGTKLEELMEAFSKQEKSYEQLRTKMSKGNHKAPKEYSTSDIGEVNADDPLLETYTEWAKENGISQDAFTKLGKAFTEFQNNVAQDAAINIEKEKQLLGANADEIIQSNVQWGQGMVQKGIFTEADYQEIEILGGTANGQRVIQKIRSLSGEREIPVASIEGQAPDKEELRAMVADPRYKTDIKYRKSVEKQYEEAFGR